MKRWLLVFSIYVLYLAAAKQMILLSQKIGIIAIEGCIPDDAIIKWASIVMVGSIVVIDVVHAIKYKKDFIISLIGTYLFESKD